MVRIIGCKRRILEIVDEDVRSGPTTIGHENADLIREKNPCSSGATSSPRTTAS